jgi:hypothetical protein
MFPDPFSADGLAVSGDDIVSLVTSGGAGR